MRTEDGSIIYRCLNGKPGAFGMLVDKYKEGVYAYVYTELGNFHDAQDVTQEVFLQAYRDLRSLRRWESFAFWLHRIAHRRCVDFLRLKSRRADGEFIEDQSPKLIDAPSIESYRREQSSQSLQEVLDSLPDIHREVLMMHYFGGMTVKDMAKAVGASPDAIRKRLSRARTQLKEEMVAMMDTAFEGQKLPAGFTLRIVEAVKRIKIRPMSRIEGLPVGLSLAIGIMIAVFGLSSRTIVHDSYYIPTGSPLLMESRVLKNGEIPVQILKTAEKPVISSKKGDLDSGKSQNTISPAPSSAKGTWGQKADMPTGRLSLSCAELNGKIYAIGGQSAQGFTNKVEEYDPELDLWIPKADMLAIRNWPNAITVNGKIYAIGGYNGQTLSSVEEYDPIKDTWKNKTPMPETKACHLVVAINNIIYVLGGFVDVNKLTPSFSAFTYDPAIDQWSRLKDIPEVYALVEGVAVAVDDKIHCFGGVISANFSMNKNILVYDVQNEKWSTKAEISERSFGVAAVIGRKVYFIGGELPFQAWSGVSDVEEYDIDTNTVEKKTDMPRRRGYISGCAIDNKIFVMGGTTDYPGNLPNDYLNIVEEFDPNSAAVEAKEKLPTTWGEVKSD